MAYPPDQPTVLFVTDPLCSWCWGMLPQMNQARDALADVARFDLLLAGLQISGTAGLSEFEGARLRLLWQKVAAATGQTFAGRLPEDPAFLYHSELACRAVEAVRQMTGTCPWSYFEAIQRTFYLDARNPCSFEVLGELAEATCTPAELERAIRSRVVREATHAGFELARTLGAHALPTVLLDTGDGPKLVCGGFATADYLIPDLSSRLQAASDAKP